MSSAIRNISGKMATTRKLSWQQKEHYTAWMFLLPALFLLLIFLIIASFGQSTSRSLTRG